MPSHAQAPLANLQRVLPMGPSSTCPLAAPRPLEARVLQVVRSSTFGGEALARVTSRASLLVVLIKIQEHTLTSI
jgi:hypothetical protein